VIGEIAQSATCTFEVHPFEVREVCAVLGASSSGYYAHQHKAERARRCEDETLTQAIQQVFEENDASYGSPRLVRVLRKRGLRTSKTRVRRLMQSARLSPHQKRRKRVTTTQSNPHLPVAPHLLLDAPPAQRPGERFHSDITYIPTQEGWLFLAATLDGYSRRCAGWSAADNMEAPLVLRSAQRALAGSRADVSERIHHSDRGSQYASDLFRDFLKAEAVDQSMSRKGNCYDNAMMESFWATLKTECFNNFREGIPTTRQQARQRIFRYIELFYNRKRLHSSLGYCSPIEFEINYFTKTTHKEDDLRLSVSS
jgi:putative transposase